MQQPCSSFYACNVNYRTLKDLFCATWLLCRLIWNSIIRVLMTEVDVSHFATLCKSEFPRSAWSCHHTLASQTLFPPCLPQLYVTPSPLCRCQCQENPYYIWLLLVEQRWKWLCHLFLLSFGMGLLQHPWIIKMLPSSLQFSLGFPGATPGLMPGPGGVHALFGAPRLGSLHPGLGAGLPVSNRWRSPLTCLGVNKCNPKPSHNATRKGSLALVTFSFSLCQIGRCWMTSHKASSRKPTHPSPDWLLNLGEMLLCKDAS